MKKKSKKLIILCVSVCLVFSSMILLNSFVLNAAPTQDYTWKNVKIVGGGYVPGIIFNEGEKNLIYARTDVGGAYKWNESSKEWESMTDWIGPETWGYTGVVSLATDTVEPNRVYMACGAYTNSWDPNNGAILCSDDYGKTWEISELPFKLGGNMPARNMGERLMIDPNDNSVLYLGAPSGNGLWKSSDYGKSWNKVDSLTNTGDFVLDPSFDYTADKVGVVWVEFDKTSSSKGTPCKTIYTGVADKEGTSIYRSTDSGKTWKAVPGQPTGFLPHHGTLASNGLLYVTYSDSCGPYDGQKGDVWKLDTSSDTWTNISPVPSSSDDNYWGYGGLAVDKQNPDTLVVSTLNSWWPDANLFRSTDGGATWKRIWEFAGYPTIDYKYNIDISDAPWLDWGTQPSPPERNPKLGWMIGDIDIDPFNSDRMMYGTGATVYGTNNLTNWDSDKKIDIKVMCNGLEETCPQDLESPPTGASLYSAMYDLAGFTHNDVDKVPAKMYQNPNKSSTSIDFAQKKVDFLVRVADVNKEQDPNVIPIGFSYDAGDNWFSPTSVPNNTGGGTVAAAADASRVVWSPKGGNVNVSTDNGNSWKQSTGIPGEAVVESDRENPKKFYGLSDGKFYVSTDGGESFKQTASDLGTKGKFRAVPGIEGDIWVTTKSGMYHSTDSGTTFDKLSNVDWAECVGFGKAAPDSDYMSIYISGQVDGKDAIYRSDNKGGSWIRLNDDKHQYAWTGASISGDPKLYGRVYVATNGRGIIYGDISGSKPSTTTAPVTETTAPVTETTPPVTETTPPVTETTPPVTETTPPITETTPPVTETTPPVTGTISAKLTIVNDWGSGGLANIIITNNGTSTINEWSVDVTVPGEITSIWGGVATGSGNVTIKNLSWNGTLSPKASTEIGLTYSKN